MATKVEKKHISYVPTDALPFYPEEDGKPMAASDLHRRQLTQTLQVLEAYYSHDPSVYVSGDILMYYVEGIPSKSISPDVLVSFGVGMKERRTYKVWEEGKVPDFVMEFSSKNTFTNDLTDKMKIYASLKIQNYFLYDAENLYLPSQLMGFELSDNNYVPIAPSDIGIRSSSLGLDFQLQDEGLGIYDPADSEWLRTPAEAAEARAAQETTRAETAEERALQQTTRAETAEERASQEVTKRQQAEAEVAQLREQITRMQTRS